MQLIINVNNKVDMISNYVLTNTKQTCLYNIVVGGDYPSLGGRVAYIFNSNDSEYVAGETRGIIFSISTTDYHLFYGSMSEGYISGTTWNNANTLCENLTYLSKSDWHLPKVIDLQRVLSDPYFYVVGISNSYTWWTIEQVGSSAKTVSFDTGIEETHLKTSIYYGLPIRYFNCNEYI